MHVNRYNRDVTDVTDAGYQARKQDVTLNVTETDVTDFLNYLFNSHNLFSSDSKLSPHDLDYGQNWTHLPLPTRWFTAVRRRVTQLGKNNFVGQSPIAHWSVWSSLHFSLPEDTC